MKTKLTLIIGLLTSLILFTGCDILDKGYDKQSVYYPPVTNTVIKLVTNTVTQAVTPETVFVVTPERTETVFLDKPIVTTGLGMTKAVPVPYAGFAGSILGLIYTGYRMIRNKQALKAVVMGIEEGRKMLQTTPELQAIDLKIKDALIRHQELAGVLTTVSDVVNTYTDKTVPQKP